MAKVQSNPIARRTALDDAAYILDAHFRENMEAAIKADFDKSDYANNNGVDKRPHHPHHPHHEKTSATTPAATAAALKRRLSQARRWRPLGHFTLYLLVKLLYLANVVFQLFCLHSFLQLNVFVYSMDVVKTLVFGHNWLTSTRFPIRTLCEFQGLPQVGKA